MPNGEIRIQQSSKSNASARLTQRRWYASRRRQRTVPTIADQRYSSLINLIQPKKRVESLSEN
jgi:hypothetical protein